MKTSGVPIDLILEKLAETTTEAQSRIQKASDVMLSSLDTGIGQTPYDVVYAEDRVKLKYYAPDNRPEGHVKTPLLIVYAHINRETMLDLQPGRSVARTFLENGIDLYMIDWGYPSEKDRFQTIDDHVNGYMDTMIDVIRERHDTDRINLMGVCMGGTLSIIYTALHLEKIKNLITTVTPSDFDTRQGLLHIWMKDIDAAMLMDAWGNMPGDIMNIGFLLLNPARLIIDKYIGFMEHADDKNFVENFLRMEKWIFDSPDVPGETFKQFVTDCYQKNLLIQSRMKVGGRLVDLKKITVPLLNIYGKYDHLVPPGACETLTKRVGSKDTQDVCLETGHIGIYVSSKTQKEFVPKIIDWLKKRDG